MNFDTICHQEFGSSAPFTESAAANLAASSATIKSVSSSWFQSFLMEIQKNVRETMRYVNSPIMTKIKLDNYELYIPVLDKQDLLHII